MNLLAGSHPEVVGRAVKILQQGGVIVYPTETAYGLGPDYLNPRAVKKIYQIKGRHFNKPVSVIVGSLAMAKKFARFNKITHSLAKEYWPGALTLVLESKNQKSKNQTLALRVSANRLASKIVKKLGRPITSTSANLSGKVECYTAAEAMNQFKNKKYQPDLIIDAGRLPKRKVSTIVRVDKNNLTVLRQGGVKIKKIL